jgi:hypothetical protein
MCTLTPIRVTYRRPGIPSQIKFLPYLVAGAQIPSFHAFQPSFHIRLITFFFFFEAQDAHEINLISKLVIRFCFKITRFRNAQFF